MLAVLIMDNLLLQLDSVSTGYGRHKVLNSVSLRVEEGSIVGIIGPNGHGKSTLLRAISGMVATWSGQITFAGKAIQNKMAHEIVEHGIVQIPEGDMIFPDMTVEENLILGAYLADSKDEVYRRLDDVYNLFPILSSRRTQISRTLSGGERRMLGIGRGLMSDGQIMLLDEPSLGLAPKIIDNIYEVLATMRGASKTLLIVEENPMRLQNFADWIYLMDNGEFVWNGSTDDLKDGGDLLNTYLGA